MAPCWRWEADLTIEKQCEHEWIIVWRTGDWSLFLFSAGASENLPQQMSKPGVGHFRSILHLFLHSPVFDGFRSEFAQIGIF